MPSRVLAVAVLLLSASSAFAAPNYSSRSRHLRIVMRSEPGQTPAPAPAPASAAPEPRLGRIVPQAYRTAPAASPVALPLPKTIEQEALAGFFPAFQSGGGFMPLTLQNRVQPRADVVIEP
ncbi:MAG: hypothetical protein HY925_00460 [Elusimicrobia bacterium]|nr:hypothetical protein [Elusimicrobiota bacterium]